MRVSKIFSAMAAAIIWFVMANVSAAQVDSDLGVNWTKNIITVKGTGIAPRDAVNYTQAKGLASKAAQVDAYRNLGEIVNGVRIEGETTIAKKLKTHDKIKMRVEAAIKGAKIIEQNSLSDGSHEVYMQMPIFGASNSLAGAVLEKNLQIEPFPDPVLEVAPSNPPYTSSTPIYQRIECAKISNGNYIPAPNPYKPPLSRLALPISFAADNPPLQRTAKKSVKDYADSAQGDFTGLIVDCRGLNLQPVMSPVIKNTNGTKIYGHKNLDVDKIVTMGVADYVKDTAQVARAGKNPLIVKAVAIEDFNSNPVVSVADSNRILIENHATKFLKDLKVVFLYD